MFLLHHCVSFDLLVSFVNLCYLALKLVKEIVFLFDRLLEYATLLRSLCSRVCHALDE